MQTGEYRAFEFQEAPASQDAPAQQAAPAQQDAPANQEAPPQDAPEDPAPAPTETPEPSEAGQDAPPTEPDQQTDPDPDPEQAPTDDDQAEADADASAADDTPPGNADTGEEADASPDADGVEEGGESLADGMGEGVDAAPPPDLPASAPSVDAAEPTGWMARVEPFRELIDAGGPIIIILAGLSVLTVALVLVKLGQFAVQRVGSRGFVRPTVRKLHAGQSDEALSYIQARRGVLARVMEAAVRGQVIMADETKVREEVTRVAQAKLDGLERGLPLLSLVATLSPLLGLLGTVLGMIEAFQQLQDAGDRVDPAILSGGIWEALLTTAAGLTVAIPAAAFYTWLQRKVDVAAQHMEDAATQVFTASIYQQGAQT